MKKILLSSALLVALAAGIAYAHGGGQMMGGGGYGQGYGMGYGMGPGMMGPGMMGPGMMGSGMMGPGMMGDDWSGCPGAMWFNQGPDSQKHYQEYLDKTSDLRKQMYDLHFEYMEAYRNPNTTKETMGNIEQKMNDLRLKMFEVQKQVYTGQ